MITMLKFIVTFGSRLLKVALFVNGICHMCLKSYAARDALHNLRTTNPDFWGELTGLELNENQLPKSNEILSEDIKPDAGLEDNDADDSALSIQTLTNVMVKDDLPAIVGTQKSGALISIVKAKNSGNFSIPLEPENVQVEGPGLSHGRGMQKKMANKQYEHFWRHNDDDGSDDNTILP